MHSISHNPRNIIQISDIAVIEINLTLCHEYGNPHSLLQPHMLGSAIGASFYPGSYPYKFGGVAKIAGVLCWKLVKAHAFQDGNKRTAFIAAIYFMMANGWTVKHPKVRDAIALEVNAIADIGGPTMEDTLNWFDTHKVRLTAGDADVIRLARTTVARQTKR
jgi:death-on-curing family protein